MQLIVILLATVSILTFLSGLITLLGAKKGNRARSAWFFIATIFATIWMISISLFLVAEPSWGSIIETATNWTYISAIFIDIALLGYINWHEKYGKITTGLFILVGLIISIIFAINPSLLYSKIILTTSGNKLVTNINPFYFTYVTFFCILVPTVILTLLRQVIKTESVRKRSSYLVLLIGFAISGTTSLICNLILPFWRWDFIWLGPIAISATIIAFYYSILRYRSLNLSSIWLKLLSYIVIITSIAIAYMIIFSLIFTAMFRGSAPSIEVIALNFVMIIIFLLLMPAINQLIASVRLAITSQHQKPKGK